MKTKRKNVSKKAKSKFLTAINNSMDSKVAKQRDKNPAGWRKNKKEKLKQGVQQVLSSAQSKGKKDVSLRQRMEERLKAARFRYINEQLYTTSNKQVPKIFGTDQDFEAYHEGFKQQVKKWPINPVDLIIKSIKPLPANFVIGDFGCGEAKLAQSVPQKVHSFDLKSSSELVVQCEMSKVPLPKNSLDVAVYCLSLMSTNLGNYIMEANRVLKIGGVLKIAEVESRFKNVDAFIEKMKRFHFKSTKKDFSHNLFYFLDFKKEADIKQVDKKKLKDCVKLLPCLYKKR